MKYIKQHQYRFGASGSPLAKFFKRRVVKQKRVYPQMLDNYVNRYYEINRLYGIIEFVGC